jgi:ADP-ribose pyrophosphatase YjhB (NUDIX family)
LNAVMLLWAVFVVRTTTTAEPTPNGVRKLKKKKKVADCAAALVARVGTLLIRSVHRLQEPQPDWWYFGGRVKPGLTPQQGAANNVKRELGLDRPPSAFKVELVELVSSLHQMSPLPTDLHLHSLPASVAPVKRRI